MLWDPRMPTRRSGVALAGGLALALLDGCGSTYRFDIDQASAFSRTGRAVTTQGDVVSLQELSELRPATEGADDIAGERQDPREHRQDWMPVAPDEIRVFGHRYLGVEEPERVEVEAFRVEIRGPRRALRFDGRRVSHLVGTVERPGATGVAVAGGVLGGAVLIGLVAAAVVWTSSGGICFGGC